MIDLGPATYTASGGAHRLGIWNGAPFADTDAIERYVTSRFGEYEDFRKALGWQPHKGIDIHAAIGTPLHALGPGKVTVAGENGFFPVAGKWVRIEHGDGLRTEYLHMSEIFVEVGQAVERGQYLGKSGNSSSIAIAPHLHLGVSLNGTYIDPAQAVVSIPVRPPETPVLDAQTAMEWFVSEYLLPIDHQGRGTPHQGTRSMARAEFVGFTEEDPTVERWEIRLKRNADERPSA